MNLRERIAGMGIWGFAFGYFACYAPYSALTKALTRGMLPSLEGTAPLTGFELLPTTVMASVCGMFAFLTFMGWWKHATHSRVWGVRVPHPGPWTFLSGVATSTIIATTTLAYSFEGVSIVFVMLLMRGGVLIIAPVVDRLAGRRVQWFSWMGLVLSLGALVVAFSERGGYDLSFVCAIDIVAYLASYFVRLRFMSKLAKSEDGAANVRYFVEEQLVASPLLLLVLGACALIGTDGILASIRDGFTSFYDRPIVLEAILIGLLSQGTGIFGGLILLDRRENTYCVPVNRSSSILAGVVASFGLTVILGANPPSGLQLLGATLIICAILFLTIPPMLERRRAAQARA